MNSFPKFGFVLLIIFSTLILSCCKDKCKDIVPVKANFTMNQEIEDKLSPIDNGDTIRKAETLTFVANVEDTSGVSFEWKIGSDNRIFTKKKFTLEFDVNETVKVRLITKKQSNLDCFPMDDGIDTTEQTFTAIEATLIPGDYVGSNKSNPTDVFTVNFINDKIKDRKYVDNLPKGCIRTDKNYSANDYGAGYRVAGIGYPNDTVKDCPGIYGVARLAKDNRTITIDYTYWNEGKKQFIKEQFIGTKK
jgi:hypothetical protein